MDGRIAWYGMAFLIVAGMMLARAPLAEWIKPDAFAARPYGWVTNQVAHIALGVAIVTATALVGWGLLREYPYRLEIGLVAVAFVVAFEIGVQGWQGRDTVEDCAFMLYGIGGSLWAFQEAEAGAVEVDGNPLIVAAFISAAVAHLVWGAWAR